MRNQFMTAISVAVLCILAHSSFAETITVCLIGCDHTSINAAIAAADEGDVIQLAAGIYSEMSVIDTRGKAITLRGAITQLGTPASILDGRDSHRVLQCINGETSDTVFENLVIQNGLVYAGTDGGGMYNHQSSPTLENCSFEGCVASLGGGICNIESIPTLNRCLF